jgi:hypothetical protein
VATTTTTLSSAVTVDSNSIVVASATDVGPGDMVQIDQETLKVIQSYVSGTTVGVLRGQNGSATAAHPSGANVTHGSPSDFAEAGQQADTTYPAALRVRDMKSYSAAGAITLPSAGRDMLAVINGTSTLAMTLAQPTKELDGSILTIVGNGKSASTITLPTTGIGNAGSGYDVLTLQNAGQVGTMLMAVNGFWVLVPGPLTGTTTALTAAIA